jgi:hypothetical protein
VGEGREGERERKRIERWRERDGERKKERNMDLAVSQLDSLFPHL